jgi:hypothetical protein
LLISALAFTASFGTVLFITVWPQYWLSAIVYREKTRILDGLSARIHEDMSKGDWSGVEAKVNVFQAIDATRTSTMDVQTIGSYAWAVLINAFPLVIQWLVLGHF